MSEKLIKNMIEGDSGYVTGWTIVLFDNFKGGIQGEYSIRETKRGTASIKVTKTKNGFSIDKSTFVDYLQTLKAHDLLYLTPAPSMQWYIEQRGLLPINNGLTLQSLLID